MRCACWINKTTDTLRICNTYWFSTATMVARKRLNVTLYVQGLSCLFSSSGYPTLNMVEHSIISAFQSVNKILKTADKVQASVAQPFFHGGIHISFISLWKTFTERKTQEAVWQRAWIIAVSPVCQTKITAMFWGILDNFRGISKFLCIYSTISRGSTNDVLRNPGWGNTALNVQW